MSQRRGNVIAQDTTGSWVELVTDCTTCRGCRAGSPSLVYLSHKIQGAVEIDMSVWVQVIALLRSLFMPLLLFCTGIGCADALEWHEIAGFALGVMGFMLGLGCSSPLTLENIKIKEIKHD